MTRAAGIVQATERLYRSLFAAALVFALGTAVWGLVIAPFNGFNHHHARSLVIGGVVAAGTLGAVRWREGLYRVLRGRPQWLFAVAVLGVAVLWADGGWRSSFYLASYAAIGLAAVAGGLRWALGCAAVLAAGYVGGLAVHDYSWARLNHLRDADSVVANTGGYFIAAYFLATPVAWLGGYVARINQVIGGTSGDPAPKAAAPQRMRTATLTPREVQVVQLVAAGLSNPTIGRQLFVSARTVQSHVANALRKTGCAGRAELAVLAVREGLVPDADGPHGDVPRIDDPEI